MKAKLPHPKVHLLELDRLVFLIDGVFAITLTLLVLDLKLPEQSAGSLPEALLDMLPRLIIYLLAFATIANQWIIHHRTFRWVRLADSRLVQLSLINLLFITLLPASAAIVGGHPGDRLAAACFSVNGILLALSAWAIWAYVAAHNDLLAEDSDLRLLNGIAQVWLYIALGFGTALVVGWWNVYVEYALWVLWSPLISLWWARRRQQMGV